jgi:hypothetical protein
VKVGMNYLPILFLLNKFENIERRKLHEMVHELNEKYNLLPNFSFTKYFYGYYSKELEDTMGVLEAAKVVNERGNKYVISRKGRKLVMKLEKEIQSNPELRDAVEKLERFLKEKGK